MSTTPAGPLRSPWLNRVAAELWGRESFRMVPDLVLTEPPTGSPSRPLAGGPRVAFLGFPSDYSLAILLALLAEPVELVGLVTSPGAHPVVAGDNALAQVARHLAVPLLRVEAINRPPSLQALEALGADLFLVASFNQILHARALELGRLGWLNVHPSLLPAYRGPEPVYWAIVNDERETGVTYQRMARAIDLGPAMWQGREPIRPDDTNGTLTRRLSALAARALPDVLRRAVEGDPGVPLDPAAGSYHTSVGHRRLEEAGSAAAAARWVRAGNPNMPAAALVDGAPQLVLEARILPHGSVEGGDRRLHFGDGELVLVRTTPRSG